MPIAVIEGRPILILGTGLFALEMAELIAAAPGRQVTGFVENLDPSRCEGTLEGLPVHWVDDIGPLAETHDAICSLGTTRRGPYIEQVNGLGFSFATFVHPTTTVAPSTTLGPGSYVGPGCVIASHTEVGAHVRINRGALIGHHTTIGALTTIQPGVNVAGACRLGPAVYVGMGAVITDRCEVGANSVIGAGAVVVKNVPANVMVLGVPAKVVREGIEGL